MIELSQIRQTDYNLQPLFQGKMFKFTLSLNFGAATLNYELRTGSKFIHIISQTLVANTSRTTFQLIENAITADGSTAGQAQPYNVNRGMMSTTSSATWLTSPTTGPGPINTLIKTQLTRGKYFRQLLPELILPANKKYLLKYTNTGISITTTNLVWYEANN